MNVLKAIPQDLDSFEGDLVVAVVGQDERPLRAANSWLDWRLYGLISELLVRELFTGKLGEKCLIPTYGKFRFDRLVLIGGGDLFDEAMAPQQEAGRARWHEIADFVFTTVQSLKVEKAGVSLPRFSVLESEKALLKTLQGTRLPPQTSVFVSRAAHLVTPLGL